MIFQKQLRQEASLLTGRLNRLGQALANGGQVLRLAAKKALDLLTGAHTKAASIGRQHAGDLEPTSPQDIEIGNKNAVRQAAFYQGFTQDLTGGRYAEKEDGGEGRIALRRRSLMYGLALTGTANEAWAKTKQHREEDPLARWVMAECEHCPGCKDEAAKGWRPISEFDRFPGDGNTPCKTFCRCHIETEQGDQSFKNVYERGDDLG